MNERCFNPVWPCAMVGAASCLAGFSDLGVIIHGSDGCYNYADMVVPDPLNCTYLIEDEIVFGASERLKEVADAALNFYDEIAVINTCAPSVAGEDPAEILDGYDVMVVDAPGFSGDFNTGYKNALGMVGRDTDQVQEREGINIEGICSVDPFSAGNLTEVLRLLNLAGIGAAAVYCRDTLGSARNPAAAGFSVNPDYDRESSNPPEPFLGTDGVVAAFSKITDLFPDADIEPVISGAEEAEERIVKACDKFLRKHDPPSAAIFSTSFYAEFSVKTLMKYLDAGICFAGTRNSDGIGLTKVPSGKAADIRTIKSIISEESPDLLLGSSFENAAAPRIPFVGLTFPQRSRFTLHNKPIAGIEGSLAFMEDVLNALSAGEIK